MMQTKRNIKGTQKKPRLTEIQRGKLEAYLDERNLSKAEIARKLGVVMLQSITKSSVELPLK
ncbi:hypothetical protein ACIQXF_22970 [Lysinibacillus sp. NPDC097231]|uniref:hypothetical protein n=1 Tax=Lysinibacillus sp. NPDC097231 TaxID=3364142 RepID=UPI0037F61D44